MRSRLDRQRAELGRVGAQLAALSPLAVLDRGYAMARRADGSIVRSADTVRAGERLALRLARGQLEVTVDAVTAGPGGAGPGGAGPGGAGPGGAGPGGAGEGER
jgi:exonuclease VII large subunit